MTAATLPDNTVVHGCGRAWQLVTTTSSAHLIAENYLGQWAYAGTTVPALQQPDLGELSWTWSWTCPCGLPVVLELPAYDRRPCTPGGIPCSKAVGNTRPLGYVHPSEHGGAWMACPCCGHQGSHIVYRDPSMSRPDCQK